MFDNNNKCNSRIRLNRITLFFISYSLTFNNLLYASSSNKETRVYYNPKEDKEI